METLEPAAFRLLGTSACPRRGQRGHHLSNRCQFLFFLSSNCRAAQSFLRQRARHEFFGDEPVRVYDPSDAAGPARLVAGADSGPVVAVEVFVEQKVVPPVGVSLELLRAAEN